jgi:rhamnosyltransferase
MAPAVSIILLTKNAGRRFEDVLTGIEIQEFDDEVEIVVIDSGSTDGTLHRAREFGCEIYEIDPDEFHHSRTRNYGARHADGDVLVYLTHDAVPMTESWLASLVEPVSADDAAVAYGRQVAFPEAKPMEKFFYSYFYPDEDRVLTAEDAEDPRRFYLENVFVSDVSAAIDHTVWQQYQFRDTVPMSEDKDFALRVLRDENKIMYEPSAAVHHSHDYSIRSQFRRRYRDGRAYARIADRGTETFVSEGFEYVLNEIRFLLTNGHAHWLPYALLYDLAHFLGFESGKRFGRYRSGIL